MTLLYPQFLILLLLLFGLFKSSNSKTLYISLALMILALTRPVIPKHKIDEKLNAKEIIIALDISYSMRANDLQPSRLVYAKELIKKIVNKNKSDRFSLFAFTTNPLILSPATTDHKLIKVALDSLKSENILTHGTDFKKLFERLQKLNSPVKNILLFTDGGDELDVDIYKDMRVFAVGMATKRGSTLKDEYQKDIKDSDGNLVISRLNPKLKELAKKSGGLFIPYDEFDISLDFIDESSFAQKEKLSYLELFWIPLLLSLFLFFISFVKIPKKILAVIPFLAISADAMFLDWYYIDRAIRSYEDGNYTVAVKSFEKIEHKTMQSQLNLANSYYQLGSYKRAKLIYSSLSAKDPRFKKIILFKLGNCYAKLKEYERAKTYYKKALSFGVDDDIVYNLKLISLKMQKQRRDFPAFKSEDIEGKNTPQGAKKQKSDPNKSKRSAKTAAGTKASGSNSKTRSSSKTIPSKITRPMGYKAYELINRGYIDEKKPW